MNLAKTLETLGKVHSCYSRDVVQVIYKVVYSDDDILYTMMKRSLQFANFSILDFWIPYPLNNLREINNNFRMKIPSNSINKHVGMILQSAATVNTSQVAHNHFQNGDSTVLNWESILSGKEIYIIKWFDSSRVVVLISSWAPPSSTTNTLFTHHLPLWQLILNRPSSTELIFMYPSNVA